MDTAVWIAAIVVCVPVLTVFGTIYGIVSMKIKVKNRELKLQEDKLKSEERLRTDELNAKVLRMDDFGLSPIEIASLKESVRQLREEVEQLRQQINSQTSI